MNSSIKTGRIDIDTVDNDGWTCMHVAASTGEIQPLRLDQVKQHKDSAHPLTGDQDVAQQLIEAKASVDLIDRRGVQTKLSISLLRMEIKPVFFGGCSPLMIGASMGFEEIVELLVQAGIYFNPQYGSKSRLVANLALLHPLSVSIGGDVNRQDKLGSTALMLAATKGDSAMVKKLLECGASTIPTDKDNHSAMSLAGFYGHVDTTSVLIDAGTSNIAVSAERHRSSIQSLVDSKFAQSEGMEGKSGLRIEEIEAMLAMAPDLGCSLQNGEDKRVKIHSEENEVSVSASGNF